MLAKGDLVCTISRHERDLLWSISRLPGMLELDSDFYNGLVSQ